jgi:hypothetical protein
LSSLSVILSKQRREAPVGQPVTRRLVDSR